MDFSAHHKFLYRSFWFLKALLVLLARILASALGFVASAVAISQENDERFENLRGGVLNYRTEKLDDGTDPFGWYEDD